MRYANIYSGTKRISCNGKTGMGCVMGSKNLKAVIVKGSGEVPVADEKSFKELADKYRELWAGHVTYSHKEYGSLMLIAQNSDQTRIKNQQVRITPEQLEKYDITMLVEKYKKGQTACYRCPVACTIKWEVTKGPYKGEKSDKLEFGHYTNMGPLLGIFDFPSLVHISDKINRLGMDCITFGWIMAMAMECWQRGILTAEDTGGIELNWGDAAVVSKMLDMISRREGFGNVLADSMPMILQKLKPEAADYGFHTKGLSFTYNCTQAVAMSLASSVATRGADHLKGHPFLAMLGIPEMIERALRQRPAAGNVRPCKPGCQGPRGVVERKLQNAHGLPGHLLHPIVAADVFGEPLILFKELGEMYQAATGLDPSGLFEATERAYQLEKCFNALLGITRKDDYRSGTRRGEEDPIHHPGMLAEYYWYRGCSEDGLPTRKRLAEIGLSDVADDLAKKGKLGERECPAINELLGKKS